MWSIKEVIRWRELQKQRRAREMCVTPRPICPKCKTEVRSSKINAGALHDNEDNLLVSCQNCDTQLIVQINISVTYSTYVKAAYEEELTAHEEEEC